MKPLNHSDLPDPAVLRGEEIESELKSIQPDLRAYVGSLIGSVAEVADIVQETNLLIWDKRADYRDDGFFKAYAFRCAYYKVMSFRRDQARHRKRFFNEQLTYTLAAEAQEMFETGADARLDALTSCLGKLPAEQLSLLSQHYVDQVSLTDIASRTRRKPSALHKIISRIRMALRLCIQQHLADSPRTH